ncbi:uncharacterized protein [Ptychodera flava]|uniref:uncharacterized protein n=1 Tax=Ptychodera flava TaxID=63121 RepID=UPI00396A71AB
MKLFIVLVAVSSLYTVSALNCYKCMSVLGEPSDCQFGFDTNPNYKTTCSAFIDDPRCYVEFIVSEDGSIVRFERGCMDEDDCEDDCDEERKGIYHVKECNQCCKGNFCNTSSHGNKMRLPSAVFITAISVLAFIIL